MSRTSPLLILALAAVGCGPEIPAGLSDTSSGSPTFSQSAPTTPTDAGSSTSSSGSSSGGSTSTASVDDNAVLAMVAQNAYQTSGTFTEVTRAPYASVAKPGAFVREWVNTSALAVYAAVSPGVTGSNVTVVPGTTIVRAVVEEDGGTIDGLTLMYKGPPGYNPALGDWWFGVTDPSGNPAEDDGGAELGLLSACWGCHVPRQNDGFLFGVPLDDRASDDGGAGVMPTNDAGTTMMDAGSSTSDDAGSDDSGSHGDGGHHHWD